MPDTHALRGHIYRFHTAYKIIPNHILLHVRSMLGILGMSGRAGPIHLTCQMYRLTS